MECQVDLHGGIPYQADGWKLAFAITEGTSKSTGMFSFQRSIHLGSLVF